jgi:peptidylprolyl isomerase
MKINLGTQKLLSLIKKVKSKLAIKRPSPAIGKMRNKPAISRLSLIITKLKGKRAIASLLPVIIVGAVVIVAVSVWAFSGTTGAQIGDMVWVDYTGTFDNGSIFDSSVNESFGHVAPLNFSIGTGQMIPGFEQAVIGMIVNESKTVHIPSEDAYGPKYFEVLLSELPSDVQIGESLTNNILEVIVINISETTATLENTHPLAGENLTFSITLVQIGNSSK